MNLTLATEEGQVSPELYNNIFSVSDYSNSQSPCSLPPECSLTIIFFISLKKQQPETPIASLASPIFLPDVVVTGIGVVVVVDVC